MACIEKTGRGWRVVSKVIKVQTHSRLNLQEAHRIKREWDEDEKKGVTHA